MHTLKIKWAAADHAQPCCVSEEDPLSFFFEAAERQKPGSKTCSVSQSCMSCPSLPTLNLRLHLRHPATPALSAPWDALAVH